MDRFLSFKVSQIWLARVNNKSFDLHFKTNNSIFDMLEIYNIFPTDGWVDLQKKKFKWKQPFNNDEKNIMNNKKTITLKWHCYNQIDPVRAWCKKLQNLFQFDQ